MEPIIFHIDVNSAYLSWSSVEKLKQGSDIDLRNIPAIIGGNQADRHGIVLAKSIPAKKFGIQTGEPVAAARRKCPDLFIEPPDHTMYKAYSTRLMDYLHTLTPEIEQVSIDECYLNFGPIASRFTSCLDAASQIRAHVRSVFGFTINIGISSKKVLAKMASDFEKPDRTHTLFPSEIQEKMWPLPVDDLFMVGHASSSRLHTMGIHTIGELATTDPALLTAAFKSHGQLMWEYANGIDDSIVDCRDHQAKGIGHSTTLASDATSWKEIQDVLLTLAKKVALRLQKSRQLAGTITVEIKYATFQSVSKQLQLLTPANTCQEIHKASVLLAKQLWNGSPVRLLGIRSSRLSDETEPVQISLFDMELPSPKKKAPVSSDKMQKLDQALFQIRQRYGEDSVKLASSISAKQSNTENPPKKPSPQPKKTSPKQSFDRFKNNRNN